MSLDYNLVAVPEAIRTVVEISDTMGFKKGETSQSPITRAIIFSTMYVGMNNITEDNSEEFYRRIKFYEKLFEPVISFGADELAGQRITLQDIKDHIGLYTNATNETFAKFQKRMLDNYNRENATVSFFEASKTPLWKQLKNWLQKKCPEIKQQFEGACSNA